MQPPSVQATCTLASLALFHAAGWEDRKLLGTAAERLHPVGGWWTMHQRGSTEMQTMTEVDIMTYT